jgi:hypothetical protein
MSDISHIILPYTVCWFYCYLVKKVVILLCFISIASYSFAVKMYKPDVLVDLDLETVCVCVWIIHALSAGELSRFTLGVAYIFNREVYC